MQAELQKATSTNALWDDGIVYYDFDDTVSHFVQFAIHSAMDEYKQHTCLKFVRRRPTSTGITQFILFQSFYYKGCVSNSIGKAIGYQQTINLASPGCDTHRTAVHEIGHAIGFWHEQSRPDRNNYLTIDWDNIKTGKASQFELRHEVDYQGEKYDYASIMHYNNMAFSGNGDYTLSIKNVTRFIENGIPNIGRQPNLSAGDIRLVNKLYKCYKPQGYEGKLRVHVQNATGLAHGTYYAQIIAYNKLGTSEVYIDYCSDAITTSHQAGWRYFEIRIKRLSGIDDVIGRQTIWIESSGVNVADSYCVNNNCVYFTYKIFT